MGDCGVPVIIGQWGSNSEAVDGHSALNLSAAKLPGDFHRHLAISRKARRSLSAWASPHSIFYTESDQQRRKVQQTLPAPSIDRHVSSQGDDRRYDAP